MCINLKLLGVTLWTFFLELVCSFVARHEQITRRINIDSYYWNFVHITSQSCHENYFLLMRGSLDFYNIAWDKVQDMPNDATLPALLRVTCLTTSRSLRCAAKVFWVLHRLPPLVHSANNAFLVFSVFQKFPSTRLKLNETNDDHVSLINSVLSRLCVS